MNNKHLLILLIIVAAFAPRCKKEEDIETLKKEALSQYAEVVYAGYEDSYNAVVQLQQAILTFLAAPSDAGFQACKTAWLAAREPYGQTEAFRFYAGPIDDADGPEGFINAWPMDESFVDYVQGNSNAGLINNPAAQPVINKQVLIALQELMLSEEAVFTGFHAIEFLLWGQDANTAGPGNRPYTDYVTDGSGTAANQARRGDFLKAATELLLDHLASVRDEWKPGGAYRNEFLNEKSNGEALGLIFFGLKEFSKGEIAGERMFVAIDTKDQEHEHSCFSDNTHNDLKTNVQGIKNVYDGIYTRTDGSTLSGRSFSSIAEKSDKAKADALRAALDDAITKINAMPVPFDQAIVNNPGPINDAIAAMHILSTHIQEVGRAIGAEF